MTPTVNSQFNSSQSNHSQFNGSIVGNSIANSPLNALDSSNIASIQPSPDSHSEIWLRGLISIAWADGHLDAEEQDLIQSLLQDQWVSEAQLETPLSPEELAIAFGNDPKLAENFLRTAVMVALADQTYSRQEDALLTQYCQALHLNPEALTILRATLSDLSTESESEMTDSSSLPHSPLSDHTSQRTLLQPVRAWFDQLEVEDPKVARLLCKLIPAQCPFERDVYLFGRRVAHIPAMCKLNPLYEQFVGLRFRALCYLADKCGEDVSSLC